MPSAIVKKGFLPTEDTSIIIVRTEAAPDIAFQAMLDRQRIVSERIRADPDVLYINSNVQQTLLQSRRSTAARSSCS